MRNSLINQTRTWTLTLCLLFPLHCGAEQFVELTAEINIDSWSYWFSEDENNLASKREKRPTSIFTENYKLRCVVGTKIWMMEGDFLHNAKTEYWFTGTNIVQQSVITKESPEATTERVSKISRFAMSGPRVGERHTRTFDSVDGNPGRPVRVGDLLQARGKVAWLAFCSGSNLKSPGRQIPLPNDLWKEYFPTSSQFADKTALFEDDFGLPRSIEVFTAKDQLIFQYQVHQSTNLLGCNLPLEFYLVQYTPARWPRTNSWEVNLTAKGKVTSIKEGSKPEIPAEVWKAVQK